MEELGSHGTDFYGNWYLNIFRKFVQKIKVSLKSDNNNGYFTWRPIYIYENISLISHLEWEMFQTKATEKIKTHILCSVTFFFFENLARLWDNLKKYCRVGQATDDNTMLCNLYNWGYKHTLRICNRFFLFYYKNCSKSPPQCYIICTLSFISEFDYRIWREASDCYLDLIKSV